MKRISQVNISTSVSFFKQKIIDTYKFNEYHDKNEPCVFWGMYREEDVNALKNHNGKKIVVWRGSDALHSDRFVKDILKIQDVTHYSISSFTFNSLKRNNISSILKPIRPTNVIKNKKKRGDSIYFYYGKDTKHAKNFYGGKLVEELKKKLPYKIIEAGKDTYNQKQLESVYENCFIGLRLTEHDGLPNTVCEMGLMGRNCIHNGDIPNCIKYNNLDDIIFEINKEYHLRDFDNQDIVDKVYDYLNVGDQWLFI